MRIGIDCYSLQARESAERGIGRYGRDLTRALLEAAPRDEFLLYAIDAYDQSGIPRASNARTRLIPAAARTNRFTSRALDSWIHGNPDDLDALLILSPIQSHVDGPVDIPRLVSVVYDLIPETLPGLYSQEPAYREAYEGYLAAVRGYDHVLTMSGSARDDLVRLRGFDPAKITVAGAAANPLFTPAPTEAEAVADRERLRALGIFRPGYLLNVGHEDPRKGSRVLAEAFSRLPEAIRPRTRLVFAYAASEAHKEEIRSFAGTLGMPGSIGDPELLDALGMSPEVHFTGWCDDLSLRALYRNAAVMVFPSLYEGFGLPLLEAMSCGCPVVAGNNSSQPEVAWPAGLLIRDAGDPDLVALEMAKVFEHPELPGAMRARGLEQARRFTWPAVAARALDAIRGY